MRNFSKLGIPLVLISSSYYLHTSDVKSKAALERLDLDTKIDQEQVTEEMTGHFGNHSSTKTDYGFRQETFEIATCILDFMALCSGSDINNRGRYLDRFEVEG